MGSSSSAAEAHPRDARRDKVVVISGCDSGFGLKLATHAACVLGFKVVAACLTLEGANRLQDVFKGTPSIAVQANLAEESGVQKFVSAAESAATSVGGGIWALVNNAGISIPGNVHWNPPATYEKTMAVNFHVPVKLTYALLPRLIQEKGRVINVTSTAGILAFPSMAPYSASKQALEAYSDSLRMEMMPWGVKVVVIQPAGMRTPLAMSTSRDWLKCYENAPEERRAPYGDEWAHNIEKQMAKNMEDGVEDPEVAVRALAEALTVKHPRARQPTGKMAKYFIKPVSWLPQCVRDGLLMSLMFPGPPPAALAKQ